MKRHGFPDSQKFFSGSYKTEEVFRLNDHIIAKFNALNLDLNNEIESIIKIKNACPDLNRGNDLDLHCDAKILFHIYKATMEHVKG